MMINKSKLAKVGTCSMDESDDLFNAEEANDEYYHEYYHDNTIDRPKILPACFHV